MVSNSKTILLINDSLDSSQDIAIEAYDGDTVLDALVRKDIAIKHACRNAACGICLTALLKGEISYGGRLPRGLSEQEVSAGYFLPCIATCVKDIIIAAPKVRPKTKKNASA